MSDVYPPHDFEHPWSYMNALEMAVHLATTSLCPHCEATGEVLPMTGTAWGIDVTHEPGCLDHEDNLPPPQRPASRQPS